jgi:hypothetical protein
MRCASFAAASTSEPVACPGAPSICGTSTTSAPSASSIRARCVLFSRRHGDDERVPQCRAYNGKARAHVAARHGQSRVQAARRQRQGPGGARDPSCCASRWAADTGRSRCRDGVPSRGARRAEGPHASQHFRQLLRRDRHGCHSDSKSTREEAQPSSLPLDLLAHSGQVDTAMYVVTNIAVTHRLFAD